MLKQIEAWKPSPSAPARDLTIEKVKQVVSRDSAKVTGAMLTLPDGSSAIIDKSAVRWLSKDEWWWLMHVSESPINDRTQLVLDVACEIFGAIKRHGLLNAEDLEKLDEWVHEQGLHHHLLHLACPWTKDMEGIPYAGELDGFDAELSDVINPS